VTGLRLVLLNNHQKIHHIDILSVDSFFPTQREPSPKHSSLKHPKWPDSFWVWTSNEYLNQRLTLGFEIAITHQSHPYLANRQIRESLIVLDLALKNKVEDQLLAF
jgi:hypothetical protein